MQIDKNLKRPRAYMCICKVSLNGNGLLFKKITFKFLNECDRFL